MQLPLYDTGFPFTSTGTLLGMTDKIFNISHTHWEYILNLYIAWCYLQLHKALGDKLWDNKLQSVIVKFYDNVGLDDGVPGNWGKQGTVGGRSVTYVCAFPGSI